MGFQLSKNDIDHVINCVPDAVERVLKVVQVKIEKFLQQRREESKDGSLNKGEEKSSKKYGGNENQMGK